MRSLPEIPISPTADSIDEWKTHAEHYVAHEFDILGSGWIHVFHGMQAPGFESVNYSDPNVTSDTVLNEMTDHQKSERQRLLDLAHHFVSDYTPIDWFIDFKSGYRYQLKHYSQIQYGLVEGVDAKVPYDLSRCCHLTVLARAWQETGDDRYRQEIMAQILDWISANPVEYGIGWHANMNVAIRLVNWIVAFSIIRESINLDDPHEADFSTEFLSSIVAHRQFIANNLEFAETSVHPNHYIADLGGLLLGSKFLEQHDAENKGWTRLALREFQLELDRQVGNDGFDYEAATNYHAFALEMFVLPLILSAKISGCHRPVEIHDWLKSNLGDQRAAKIGLMFKALRDIIQPNHLIPLIGDIDNGRLLYLESPGHHQCDWRFLCCLGATIFEDPTLLPDNFGPSEYSTTLALIKDHTIPEPDHTSPPRSVGFPQAGFYIIKSASIYSAIFAGPIGTNGQGGHSHDDKLSFTLSIGKLDFIVDPGIFTYTASKEYRDLYRSCLSHNTVCVGDQPQNRHLEDSPWWGCHEDTKCKVLEWQETKERVTFKAQHQGYLRLPEKIIHTRSIELNNEKRTYEVLDHFVSELSEPTFPTMSFHLMFHPECQFERKGDGKVAIQRGQTAIDIEVMDGEWSVTDACISPSYGIKLATKQLILNRNPGIAENRILIRF